MVKLGKPQMIDTIIEKLTQVQRDELLVAFEQELSKFFKLDNGKIIGVNLNRLPKVKILEQEGNWFLGELL